MEAAALRLDAALEALGEPPPTEGLDAASLEARAAEARREADAARERLGSSLARRGELARASARLEELSRELAQRSPRWDAVRAVAAAVNGRAAGRTRLSRYVLIDAFERVVACASARLDVISDGRFRLLRRDLRQAGREFELAVTDSYHGAGERPAASLSGGEMFLASLAMALGLSDVLQAASGGVHLESLFVDEGFGSLDEESLDKAVAVLEQLRARSRLVGVVSHVAEMRRRIPARLEVLRADGGSVTRTAIRAHHRGLGEAKP
ncbi:MAG: SbcC/MukB-like Walker B domain-containing protein [Polyangiales bacterium]